VYETHRYSLSVRRIATAIGTLNLILTVAALAQSPAAKPASAIPSQQKHVIPGPKSFPYSDGIAVGNTLFIAGQQGRGGASRIGFPASRSFTTRRPLDVGFSYTGPKRVLGDHSHG